MAAWYPRSWRREEQERRAPAAERRSWMSWMSVVSGAGGREKTGLYGVRGAECGVLACCISSLNPIQDESRAQPRPPEDTPAVSGGGTSVGVHSRATPTQIITRCKKSHPGSGSGFTNHLRLRPRCTRATGHGPSKHTTYHLRLPARLLWSPGIGIWRRGGDP